jgi:phosphatidylserine/phosphatidylglycerophosphate/cardiolipin synthase-like enzyme
MPSAAAKAKAAPAPFNWDDLASYKAEERFLDGYPPNRRTFFSPRDHIDQLLRSLLTSAQHSIVLNMYGYADEELDQIIHAKLETEHVYVQMNLDKSQAGGVSEKKVLEDWKNELIGNSIAIGTSSKHAISHLKVVIVDGVYTVSGSTNWSISGETEQDNQLTLDRSAVIAAEMRSVLDLNHDEMLKQMAKARAKEAAAPKA